MAGRLLFTVREDGYSFQMTSPSSRRFFLRLTTMVGDTRKMTFSDFILEPTDDDLAVRALQELEKYYGRPQPGMMLKFHDIYPAYRETNDKKELIRRHDRIVSIIRTYLSSTNISIDNIYLDQHADKFDTIVLAASGKSNA